MALVERRIDSTSLVENQVQFRFSTRIGGWASCFPLSLQLDSSLSGQTLPRRNAVDALFSPRSVNRSG